MKQIYRIAICDSYDGYYNYSCEGYFDAEDPDLIDKIKKHLITSMFYRGSLDKIESINKDTFENIIYNLQEGYEGDIFTLE